MAKKAKRGKTGEGDGCVVPPRGRQETLSRDFQSDEDQDRVDSRRWEYRR